MPVLTPPGFVLFVVATALDSSNQPVDIVHADGQDKYKIQVHAFNWDGTPYGLNVPIEVYFSDGRTKISGIIASGFYFETDVTSATARTIELTVVDKTQDSSYFTTKTIQFSAV